MPVIHNTPKIRQGKQMHPKNLERQPWGYSCALCGGERYHLVLIAEALNNRVGLIRRCGNCNASEEVIEGVGTAL